jgi:BirA family biotin operon repressor/biotin-[acetyl-CoA-carboxylase] ligase
MSSKIVKYFKIDSTNLEAKRLIDIQSIENTVIISAKRQTQGRGRLDRAWVSMEGNLMFSIVLPQSWVKLPKLLPACTAIAVREAISPNNNILFKWPNDVLIAENENPKKCCGILIEKYGDFYIIGIGVNVEFAPENNVVFPAACLKQYSLVVHGEEKIFQNLLPLLNQSNKEIINKWQEKNFFHNKNVKINEINGIFYGVDENFNAILLCGNEKNVVSFGDVGM